MRSGLIVLLEKWQKLVSRQAMFRIFCNNPPKKAKAKICFRFFYSKMLSPLDMPPI